MTAPRTQQQAEPRTPALPWGADDLLRWLTLTVIGLIMIIVGWYLSSGAAKESQQVGPANLAIGGAIVAAGANVAWLLRGRRAIGRRRRNLLGEPLPEQPVRRDQTVTVASTDLVAGPGLDNFHRPDCALAAGRHWPVIALGTLLSEGRKPCGVCQP